jgi:hypothetical protein
MTTGALATPAHLGQDNEAAIVRIHGLSAAACQVEHRTSDETYNRFRGCVLDPGGVLLVQ